MYITRVDIRNLKSIKHLTWNIDAANAPGWHVILGDNGSGKSTFVRGIALALLGEQFVQAMHQDWFSWISQHVEYDKYNSYSGGVIINVTTNTNVDYSNVNNDAVSVGDIPGFPNALEFGVCILPEISINGQFESAYVIDDPYGTRKQVVDQLRSLGFDGFSSSFGPFRRFTGGNVEENKLFESPLRYVRHFSVFSESTALQESLKWLQLLRFRSLENDAESKYLLRDITEFINQENFLPFGAQLFGITSRGVQIRDGNGCELFVEEMSDGYRTVLSLTFELLRQLSVAFGPGIFEPPDDGGKITVNAAGVVQIDEVDIHLHPTWQKRIGFWFTEHFPNIQFIVTTHSPLVCQAAEKGSIFLLPRPGTDEVGRMLKGAERDRLVYGDILDAYSTEAFGGGETRSVSGQLKLDRLADLNIKEMLHGLTASEQVEQEDLRSALPSSATAVP